MNDVEDDFALQHKIILGYLRFKSTLLRITFTNIYVS